MVQIFGTCEECRTGQTTPTIDGTTTELVFARDALRIAIATERSGLEFYTRAADLTKDPRGRDGLSAAGGRGAGAPRHARERAIGSCSPAIRSSNRGRRSCSSRARPSGLFAEGADKLRSGVDDQQALLIGIKCERGSHKFFKRYGERFEDSEGKQIFLEFADEEREHLDLLIREYRALRERATEAEARPAKRAPPGSGRCAAHLHSRGSS